MQSFLPYGRPCLDEAEIKAVTAVLQGAWLTTGPKVAEFERAVAAVSGAAHAVSCSSGTAGLHMAAMALDLGEGTTTVVPSTTFLATANAVRLTGGEVVFADVDSETGLLTPATLSDALDRAKTSGAEVKAAIPVHMNGQCCAMPEISTVARAHDLQLIEDAAHAIGASYAAEGETAPAGDCRYSEMTVFSTHPVKVVTTAEGGVVTTNDASLADRLTRLRNHGMRRDPEAMRNRDMAMDARGQPNPWYYEMHELAPNYRLTDVQCALGLVQLTKIEGFLARRRALVDIYDALLRPLAPAVRPIPRMPGGVSAFHLYAVLINFETLRIDKAALMNALREQGIGTQVHYIPVHHQPYYRDRYGTLELPGADAYYAKVLSLPLFVDMTEGDVERVVTALRKTLAA